MTYDFPDHERGDTFDGITFTVEVNSVALNLTSASIVGTFVLCGSSKTYTLSTANGCLTITNAVAGIFTVDEQVIDWTPGVYTYEFVFTLSDGSVKTYLDGTWEILR